MSLPEGDPRHGTNGYCNLGCRCDICRSAATKAHRGLYVKVSFDVSHDLHATLKTQAQSEGRSMRAILIDAVEDYLWARR